MDRKLVSRRGAIPTEIFAPDSVYVTVFNQLALSHKLEAIRPSLAQFVEQLEQENVLFDFATTWPQLQAWVSSGQLVAGDAADTGNIEGAGAERIRDFLLNFITFIERYYGPPTLPNRGWSIPPELLDLYEDILVEFELAGYTYQYFAFFDLENPLTNMRFGVSDSSLEDLIVNAGLSDEIRAAQLATPGRSNPANLETRPQASAISGLDLRAAVASAVRSSGLLDPPKGCCGR